MDLRDGLNINCFPSQLITFISLSDMAIQIIAMAQEKHRININPLDILCRYICPNPQKKNDSIAAVICRCDFGELLFVIDMRSSSPTG
jgi:hypothetical protein